MKEFKKVLFPVDLSESSAKIVPYVRAVAGKFDARIHLLFVARLFDYFTGIYVPHPSIMQFEKEIVTGAEQRMSEFTEEHFADRPDTEAAVVLGDASEEIIRFVVANDIDLIVMGTHGRKGLDKAIFGSVAERVIKSAPVPVLVVNPHKTT